MKVEELTPHGRWEMGVDSQTDAAPAMPCGAWLPPKGQQSLALKNPRPQTVLYVQSHLVICLLYTPSTYIYIYTSTFGGTHKTAKGFDSLKYYEQVVYRGLKLIFYPSV